MKSDVKKREFPMKKKDGPDKIEVKMISWRAQHILNKGKSTQILIDRSINPYRFISRCARLGQSKKEVSSSFLKALSSIPNVAVSTEKHDLEQHSKGESHHTSLVLPSAVVYPKSTEAVSDVVRLCGDASVSIVPFGAGTSVEGHVCCLEEGISLDLSKMDKIHLSQEVGGGDLDDFHVTVDAGVRRLQLNDSLRHTGMKFMVDPGADATIGGMVACGASGTSAVKYGTMRENILAVRAVLPDGSIVQCGTNARKSSAGYDLLSLMCGSEGTLGVITDVTVKLHPLPSHLSAAVCVFETLHEAAQAVAAMMMSGVSLNKCEILDEASIDAFNKYSTEVDDMPLKPHLFLEFSGSTQASVDEEVHLAQAICSEEFGCQNFQFTSNDSERKRMWEARHKLYYASLALRPGSQGIVTDACVPMSSLADIIDATSNDVRKMCVVGPCFGHAGDGNFHCILPIIPGSDTPEYLERVFEVNRRLAQRAIDVGGTVTGEHGVGSGKIDYLAKQYGDETVQMMATIKRALDPKNIMNPRKVVIV